MPFQTDSRIPLSVEPVQFNNPFGKLGEIRQQQQQATINNQTIARNERQAVTAQTDTDDAAKKKLEDQGIMDAADAAYTEINSGNADRILSGLDPKVRTVAEGYLAKFGEAKSKRDALAKELAQESARFSQAMGYDPVATAAAIKLNADLYPEQAEALQAVTDPVKLRKMIDHYAGVTPKAPEGFTLSADQTRYGADGQVIAQAPSKPAGEPTSIEAAIVAATRAKDGPEVRRLLNLKGQLNAAGRAPESATAEPLVAVMGPNGEPVLVKRSAAEGQRPASTREQGRPVTSGDAGRLAELDTSLSDLDVLAKTLGTTGAASKVGASMPNWVTEATGWGADAKSRQGTIDRVKQVIGKALEGGVLRKEDEIKYEKILPTIGDPPAVAKTKLEGLAVALKKRKQTTMDALADAGYDTSRFASRDNAAPGAPTTSASPAAAPAALSYQDYLKARR